MVWSRNDVKLGLCGKKNIDNRIVKKTIEWVIKMIKENSVVRGKFILYNSRFKGKYIDGEFLFEYYKKGSG